MMVSCPKCGFSQPSDRYCASCGIDMQNYKPVAPPLAQKVMTNWLAQVAILALVLGGVYAAIKTKHDSDLKKRIAEIEQAPKVRVIEELTKETRDPTPTPAPIPEVAEAGAPDAALDSAARTAPPPAAASPAPRGLVRTTEDTLGETLKEKEARPEAAAGGAVTAAASIRRLSVQFLEMPRTLVAEMISATRNLASYSTFSSGGVLPDMSTRLRSGAARGSRSLSASEHAVSVNEPILIFKGMHDETTGQNLGLTTQITPVSNDEQGVQVQVEIMRFLREGGSASQPTEQVVQEAFLIPKGGGAYLAGLLPHRALDAEETQKYSAASVLRILTSPSFQNNSSEFVVVIEAK